MDPKIEEVLGAESDEEAKEFAELAAELGFAGPLERPSPGLKARLMAAIEATLPPGVHILRQGGKKWRPTPYPGVFYKSLFMDRETQMHTLLLKLEPGAIYPRHRHARPEQCLVVSGDVSMGEAIQLSQGDFEWAEGQTTHDGVTTRNGCELLIISSLKDEVLGQA
jgi:anti-sigma factor ChrR (cupin superfamily)